MEKADSAYAKLKFDILEDAYIALNEEIAASLVRFLCVKM
jgi:hypothetical protein